jgi:Family of unknown function (DUF6879)
MSVELGVLLQNFRLSAFRLETLARYTVPQEEEWFAEWRQTGKLPELTPDNDPWLRLVRDHCTAGKKMQRVRVVSSPLTDYERFELSLFPPSVAAGEEIRVIQRTTVVRTADFWLFDESTAVMLRYDNTGCFQGIEDGTASTCRQQRDRVLSRSIPLEEYLATL